MKNELYKKKKLKNFSFNNKLCIKNTIFHLNLYILNTGMTEYCTKCYTTQYYRPVNQKLLLYYNDKLLTLPRFYNCFSFNYLPNIVGTDISHFTFQVIFTTQVDVKRKPTLNKLVQDYLLRVFGDIFFVNNV